MSRLQAGASVVIWLVAIGLFVALGTVVVAGERSSGGAWASKDPAGFVYDAAPVVEECARMWVVEKAPGDNYRVVQLHGVGRQDANCAPPQVRFDVQDYCGRAFRVERDMESSRARLTRVREQDRFRYADDAEADGCPQ